MRPEDAEGPAGPGDDVRAALAAWRDGLVEPGGANRLIDLPRGGADLVEIVAPDPAGVVAALRHGRDCPLTGAGSRKTTGALRTDLPDDVLQPLLRRLRRHARLEQADRGVDVLHLAVGLLHWQDTDGAAHASPLLLVPADLVTLGPGEVPRLRAGAGDPIVNPALAARLSRFGITLPEVDDLLDGADLADFDVAALTAAIGAAVSRQSGWRTAAITVLARFDPAAEAIHRDLLENEDRVLAHPVVRALAESDGTPGAFAFEPVAADEIDVLAPPDDVPLVLDADAAQRACVAAACEGHSFVVDGPPGTGKSQTIANMIGALTHAGKRVLFVSEKASALDTVQHRLAAAGLGNYLLDLHGARASRKQVAATLAAALDAAALPGPGMDADARDLLRERREQLNAYARAVHEPRPPLSRSLQEMIGRFARLAGVPEAPAPALHAAALTDEALDRIRGAAERLTRAWRPANERSGFRWREVAERSPLAGALHDALLALENLAAAAAENATVTAAFHLRLPTDAAVLSEIAEHAAQRPADVADQWLTATSLRPIRLAAEELGQRLEVSRRAAEAVRHRAGVSWEVLAAPMDLDALPETPRLEPPAVRTEPLTAAEAKALAGRFAADADELEHQQRNLDRATTRLGLPEVITFSDVELVHLIADLGARPDKPDRSWFSPGAQSAVHTAAGTLRLHVEAVSAARAGAHEIFTEAALTEPVEDLAERFATVHRGARKLLAPHRRDKETVAGFTRPGVGVDEAVAELGLAVAWRRAHEGLVAAEQQHAGMLGRYWKRLDTDFPAIGRALQTVAEVLRVTPPEALGQVVDYVCAPHVAGDELHRAVTEARDVFRHWRATLRPEPDPAGRPELGHGPVQHAITWMRAQVGPLGDTAALLRQLGDAVGRDLNVAEAIGVIEVRQGVIEAEQAFAAAGHGYATTLGAAFRGKQTDLRALEDAVEWTAHTRTLRTGADAALNNEQAQAMTGGRPAPDLTGLLETWQSARQRIIDAFGPARQVRLATALDRYETARDLLRDLLDDDTGQGEWFEYLTARGVLAEYGVDGAVDFCADHGVDVHRLGEVIERAAYRSWIDAIIAEDERLQPLTSAGRDELTAEFRRLDAELSQDAAGAVIEALNARRPDGGDGGPALIRAEGEKQDGHLPVRDQLAAAWDTVAALKPCLVMPPSAVSRLLPDRAAFDVVVIDEASRMTPAAAAACAYRGTSLVIVGDDAQLPPAGDQPSVLVVANDCGAFTRLGLTGHYRSRHESLIAFANRTFYQDRLVTFPSAHEPGPDLGVQLYPAGPENEAGAVAERVLHHLTTRPSLSLGVVTLTAAHADGIADAVEAALAGRPDLEGFLGDFVVEGADAAQGDERDVIILSTGADLGAAGGPTGARRLDVAITRARQRVEVVSAISAADRDEPGGEGERRLAAYLDDAGRGGPAAGARALTPLEESVRDTLQGWGHPADGLSIGIGVRLGDSYVLGVRCEPPAGSARDRERLHDQVLQGLGWRLHRVWSVAWHTDRENEETRLRIAVENALATPDVFADLPEETLTARPAQRPEWALPYERADVPPLPAATRLDDDAARRLLIGTVEHIAEVEGPVHVATLTRRIREAWGLSRLTQQLKAAIETAITQSRAGFDGAFVTAPDAPIPAVRVPADGLSRKPDQVADAELQLALEYLVLDAGLVEGEDLLAAAGRLFGWSGSRTGAARLAAMLDDLVSAGRLIAHRNGLIAAPENDLLDLPDPATLPRREETGTGMKVEVNL